MLMLFAAAFILGLVFSVAPGPVFAETVRQGVRGGFRAALAVQIGSLVGDALWTILGLAGVGLLLQLESLRVPIGIAGVAYLLWLAWEAWRASEREFAVSVTSNEGHSGKALRSGVLLSLTNPQNLAYWAAIGTALGVVGVQEPTVFDYTVFFLGFMASSIVWALFFAALVDRVFSRAGALWARITYRACAIALLALAVSSLRELWVSRQPSPTVQEPSAISGEP
jgi:chemosensory pili system protein ChpE/L-lysine exporter family protein LysE/ArgO